MPKHSLDITHMPMLAQAMAKYAQSDVIRQASAVVSSGLIAGGVASAYGISFKDVFVRNLITKTDSWTGAKSRFLTNLLPLSIAFTIAYLIYGRE